jgi:hypothetical protein
VSVASLQVTPTAAGATSVREELIPSSLEVHSVLRHPDHDRGTAAECRRQASPSRAHPESDRSPGIHGVAERSHRSTRGELRDQDLGKSGPGPGDPLPLGGALRHRAAACRARVPTGGEVLSGHPGGAPGGAPAEARRGPDAAPRAQRPATSGRGVTFGEG